MTIFYFMGTNMERIYLTNWLTEYRCVYCKHSISYHNKIYSRGRCPHCGEKHPSACTTVETTEHAYRLYVDFPEPHPFIFWLPRPERKREYKNES